MGNCIKEYFQKYQLGTTKYKNDNAIKKLNKSLNFQTQFQVLII